MAVMSLSNIYGCIRPMYADDLLILSASVFPVYNNIWNSFVCPLRSYRFGILACYILPSWWI